ncbi:sensor histidine kinase N-terminal domain-containing protein [soil metagenome]
MNDRIDDRLERSVLDARPKPVQRSLFGEILDWMLAPLLLLWPLSIAATYVAAQSIANAPFDRRLESAARVLSHQVQEAQLAHRRFELTPSARALLPMEASDAIWYQVRDAAGAVIAGEQALPLPPDDDIPGGGVVRLREDSWQGREVRVAWTSVDGADDGGSSISKAMVQVAEPVAQRSQLATEIVKGLVLPQFLVLPIAVVLVWAGLSRGIKPLKLLQDKIRSRGPDDLSPIEPTAAPDEIAPLVSAFNELLGRLSVSVDQQKRFIADAAHQMKTPLAGVRTQAEMALRQQDPAEVRRSLEQIVRGSERATHMINQLLAMARAESETGQAPAFELLDLCHVAREAVAGFFDVAVTRGIDLGFEDPGSPLMIRGNRLLVVEMIKNLVDNALSYTPRSGSVTVRTSSEPSRSFAVLEVEDTGPGIPPEERPMVFQRFYRVLGSGQDGSGLGLAIVREIASHHDATTSISENPSALASSAGALPGCTITIQFPRVRRPEAFDD